MDGICRLIEWGADARRPNASDIADEGCAYPLQVNIADNKRRTPIHLAAAGGNYQARPMTRATAVVRCHSSREALTKACMLLLEMGADMNAKAREWCAGVEHDPRTSWHVVAASASRTFGSTLSEASACLARSLI